MPLYDYIHCSVGMINLHIPSQHFSSGSSLLNLAKVCKEVVKIPSSFLTKNNASYHFLGGVLLRYLVIIMLDWYPFVQEQLIPYTNAARWIASTNLEVGTPPEGRYIEWHLKCVKSTILVEDKSTILRVRPGDTRELKNRPTRLTREWWIDFLH